AREARPEAEPRVTGAGAADRAFAGPGGRGGGGGGAGGGGAAPEARLAELPPEAGPFPDEWVSAACRSEPALAEVLAAAESAARQAAQKLAAAVSEAETEAARPSEGLKGARGRPARLPALAGPRRRRRRLAP